MTINRISAAEFETLRSSQTSELTIVDLRTQPEIDRENIDNCICLPFQGISAEAVNDSITTNLQNEDQRVFLLCQSGMRAEATVRQLGKLAGVEWVIIEGGINGIKAAGGNINKGERKSIPLERQVRIAAGIVILAGVILGINVNPNFLLMSGFVGAGLIFAGVTNRCGLAFLLTRMPWNR
ncbi:rhodanese-like domain-containing protein [Teredinibacter haidensis]|uniref:rhodanese-like domain-containing protein n=1 Tax=Teredinibacter haidensis TaxID=2731755 RepID=UPI0009489C6B|nr:rhodanese-like domain-containing protein [Teredinibacter haidensis]